MVAYARKKSPSQKFASGFHNTKIFGAFFTFFLFLIIPVTILFLQNRQVTNEHAASTGFPHVQGTQILDGNGNPLLLRGAMIETSFAYIKRWQQGQDPLSILNTNTFNAMASWGMNAVRINISQWIYQYDASSTNPVYLSKLDTAISQANAAGLYVILDFHDDGQSGSPYGDGMLHQESIGFWKMIASRYLTNTMVLYDPINEPKYPDWCSWQYGGNPQGRCTSTVTNTNIVGLQDIIIAIRSVGGQQIITVEPGAAAQPDGKGWAGFDPSVIKDQNIVYSKHDYGNVVSGNPTTWDAEWGTILNVHPIYYGEWAVLPDPNYPSFCKGVTSNNADQITDTFMEYMNSRHASWTAWSFTPGHMVKDITTYTPTNFQDGSYWTCQSQPSTPGSTVGDSSLAGMGLAVKNFIATHPTPTLTPTNTPIPTPILTNTPTPSPIPRPTLRIDSAGAGGIGALGAKWQADTGYIGGQTVNRGNIAIANTQNPWLYQTERYGMSGYSFTLPNGNYLVKLHFAETNKYLSAPGKRVFSIAAQGNTVISNLDIFSQAGGANIAMTRSFSVNVTNGTLSITFIPKVQQPKIDALEISPQ